MRDHKHPAPERTAYKDIGGSNIHSASFGVNACQVWPNRESMARSIRMQQQRAARPDDWRAVVPLGANEGY